VTRPGPPEARTMTRRYCVCFESCGEGVLVSVPALPGCFSFGPTRAEAERRIREAAALYLDVSLRTGDAIPDNESLRPMVASEGCAVTFMTFAASAVKPGARPRGRPESPIAGYEIEGVSRGHLLARRPVDHRKVVLPRFDGGDAPQAVRRMIHRVLIGDRSFHVPFFRTGG